MPICSGDGAAGDGAAGPSFPLLPAVSWKKNSAESEADVDASAPLRVWRTGWRCSIHDSTLSTHLEL